MATLQGSLNDKLKKWQKFKTDIETKHRNDLEEAVRDIRNKYDALKSVSSSFFFFFFFLLLLLGTDEMK